MKAVTLSRYGGPEVLTYQEVPTPEPGEGQVLVRLEAIGLNFGDTVIRQGLHPYASLPAIPGSEAAGVVERLGPGVTGVAVGDRVAAPLWMGGRLEGAYAEAVAVDARLLVPLSEAISFEQAAAVTLQGLTALWMLAQVPATGRTVLVHAAAGGAGSLLVQVARLKGARRIIATASTPEKLALAQRLGADIAVSYAEPDWPGKVRAATDGRGPDVIYDQVGGEVLRLGFELLAPRGTLAIYGTSSNRLEAIDPGQIRGLIARNQSVVGFSGWPLLGEQELLRTSLEELFGLVHSGRLEVLIGRRYPLAEAAEAHRALGARETTGKVLLVP